MSDLSGGERRTDHRAYAEPCPSCKAAPWRACVGMGVAKRGEPLAKPHLARVKAKNARDPEPEVRTAQDEGTVGVVAMHFGGDGLRGGPSGDEPR